MEGDNECVDRVVHVEMAFVVHGTMYHAINAGKKVVHDTEVAMHREIDHSVHVDAPPQPEEKTDAQEVHTAD